jgi:hypothetical protein
MKTNQRSMVVPTVLALMVTVAGATSSNAEVIELTPGFKNDPLIVKGQSGGQKQTRDCGKIAATPNQTIKMSGDFPYLRFSLQSTGKPTLLIQEPGGKRTCVSADSFSGGTIESPGYWKQGTYQLYIGDRVGGGQPYTLTITQKAN